MEAQDVGAIVLSGGGAARLGGADKATIEVGGRTLLEHALAALADVSEVVVVGEHVPTSRPVTFTREDPPGGGPAAGLLAGLRAFPRTPTWVVALAVDMPLVTRDTVHRLIGSVHDNGAVLVDGNGRLQYLCAAYSVTALERARSSHEAAHPSGHGLAMRALVGELALTRVAARGDETRDLDTWDDLAEVREGLGGQATDGPERQP